MILGTSQVRRSEAQPPEGDTGCQYHCHTAQLMVVVALRTGLDQ